MNSSKNLRELWIDYVKLFACALVVLGHFLQSMLKSNIVSNGFMLNYVNTVFYQIHVPIFFFCSGYLYQRKKISDFSCYLAMAKSKAVYLCVPYFTFSIITIALKSGFKSSINNVVDKSILETLLFYPIPPYWFLLCLLLCFLITVPFANRRYASFYIGFALLAKFLFQEDFSLLVLKYFLGNYVWFVAGCAFHFFALTRVLKWKTLSIVLLWAFFIMNFYFQINLHELPYFVKFILTIFGSFSVLSVFFMFSRPNLVISKLCKYTMHIYLLHTICAASIRILLIMAGVKSSSIHVVFGLIGTFTLPVCIGLFVGKTRMLNFFFNPVMKNKYHESILKVQ